MNIKHGVIFPIAFLVILFGSSCTQDNCTSMQTFYDQIPVYMTIDEMRSDIEMQGPKELKKPGKIYFYNDYIFINEVREGIHIVNNSDPANPITEGFLSIPGNVDMAIKDNKLFADNYMDLLTIDIQDLFDPTLLSRNAEVFPLISYLNDGRYLAYYNIEEVTREVDCNGNNNLFLRNNNPWVDNIAFDSNAEASAGSTTGSSGSGVGGSMARFTLVDDYLYTVDNSTLRVFDLSNINEPNEVNEVYAGWGIETVFPYENNLFLGGNSGMYIYSINDPSMPEYEGRFDHARACDPVVVKDDVAYVTLRDGTFCEGFDNQMDVIDVSNINNPKLVKSMNMSNPRGLSILNNNLFVCDGDAGLKVYDISDLENPDKIDRVRDFATYDVIALDNNVIMVIGDDGFFQFDASNVKNLKELSVIPVTK